MGQKDISVEWIIITGVEAIAGETPMYPWGVNTFQMSEIPPQGPKPCDGKTWIIGENALSFQVGS